MNSISRWRIGWMGKDPMLALAACRVDPVIAVSDAMPALHVIPLAERTGHAGVGDSGAGGVVG